jgi:aryl-alcohol dehydrogenase-like predicted oxidoreductase
MEFRQVGSSDLRVSVAGLGCNNFGGRLDLEGSRRVIDRALDLGVNFFDTADSYGNRGGSERILGQVLGAGRNRIVLATKFGWPMNDAGTERGASPSYIFAAVEQSLKRLNTDWIDLYQLHVPDHATPIDETLAALETLIQQGKVRYVGCSNFDIDDLRRAQAAASRLAVRGFVSCQNHYNLLTRDIEVAFVPEMRRLGIGLLPYAPLAAGLLTGKYHRDRPMPQGARLEKAPNQAERYLNDVTWRIIESLMDFAARSERSLLQLAVAWLATRDPVCSVIAGAMSPQQVDENVAALGWRLSLDDLAEIDRMTKRD